MTAINGTPVPTVGAGLAPPGGTMSVFTHSPGRRTKTPIPPRGPMRTPSPTEARRNMIAVGVDPQIDPKPHRIGNACINVKYRRGGACPARRHNVGFYAFARAHKCRKGFPAREGQAPPLRQAGLFSHRGTPVPERRLRADEGIGPYGDRGIFSHHDTPVPDRTFAGG